MKLCNLLQTRWRAAEKRGARRRGEGGGVLGAGSHGAATGAAPGTGRGPAGSTVVFAFHSVCFFFPA